MIGDGKDVGIVSGERLPDEDLGDAQIISRL